MTLADFTKMTMTELRLIIRENPRPTTREDKQFCRGALAEIVRRKTKQSLYAYGDTDGVGNGQCD